MLHLTQSFDFSFRLTCHQALGFPKNRPGTDYLKRFSERDSQLSMRGRIVLENERAESMAPPNNATHYNRLLKALVETFNINDPSRIFNFGKSDFSINGMTFGRSKCIVKSDTRDNTRDPMFKGTRDHVTLMPVISASGEVLNPLLVLPGTIAKYSKRIYGTFGTRADFLTQPSYVLQPSVAGVDPAMFFNGDTRFVDETTTLRRGGKYYYL